MGGWRSLRRVPFFMSKAANATLSTGHGKEADARHAEVKIDIKKGIHVAASKSITVAEAGKRWTVQPRRKVSNEQRSDVIGSM